jgi:hypothetical protein
LIARNGECDEYVLRIRGCTISNKQWAFVGNKYIRMALWRIAERFWGKLPTFQIGGNVLIEAGTKLEINTTMYMRSSKV